MTTTHTETAHWPSCTGDDTALEQWQGREGDAMQTCRICARISVVGERQSEPPTPRRISVAAIWPEADDVRQAYRRGDRWPRHRARKRNRRRRAPRREQSTSPTAKETR